MNTNYSESLLEKDNKEDQNFLFGIKGEFKWKDVFDVTYTNPERKAEDLYLKNCKDANNLANIFRTNLETGLDGDNADDLKWREELWGNNHIKKPKPNYLITHIINCLCDQTLIILMIAATVSLIIGLIKDGISGSLEGCSIYMAVVIVTAVSSVMNWKQVEEFNMLNQKNKIKKVVVIRKSEELTVTNEDILVGDIIKIKYGNIAVADGILLTGHLNMNEDPVTGESNEMKKTPNFTYQNDCYTTPFIFSGSECKNGEGTYLVVSVGRNTFGGRNEELKDAEVEEEDGEDTDQTPLQRHLAVLANRIGDFGFIMALIIGTIMIIKEFASIISVGGQIFTQNTINVFVNAFIIASK